MTAYSPELRLGRWQEALADVTECDAVITDPPYGERTHNGNQERLEQMGCRTIEYSCFSPDLVREFVEEWSKRCRGWICAMTSDDLVPAWRAAFASCGRYDFAPVPIVSHRLRMIGDGPASAAVYLMVSRPRRSEFMGWGSLPGWYQAPVERGAAVIGAKPLGLMRAVVGHYSRHGDLVVDPCAGGATTLLAASIEGRRSIGSEMDPETFAKAQKRLAAGFTPDLFAGVA